MRFDNLHAHEALMNQLPTWFKPVLEYIALMEAYGVALDGLNEQGQAIYYNQFIQTADTDTLAVWEKLFGITLRYGDTLDFRRQRLLQKFNQIVPYTVWHLRDRLTELYGEDGYTLEVDPVACTISILVTSDRYGAIDLLYDLIWDVVPAHLAIRANQETTSYAVSDQYVAGILAKTLIQNLNIRTVEKTVSGDIVSINDSAGFPAVDLSVSIEPVQDLHGYDNPWPAGGRKNLLPPLVAPLPANGTVLVEYPTERTFNGFTLSFSFSGSFGTTGGAFLIAKNANDENTWVATMGNMRTSGGTTSESGVVYSNEFLSYANSGTKAVKKVLFYNYPSFNSPVFNNFQLEEGTTRTSFEPYSNICPITGWDEVKVTRTGRNLLDADLLLTLSSTITKDGNTYRFPAHLELGGNLIPNMPSDMGQITVGYDLMHENDSTGDRAIIVIKYTDGTYTRSILSNSPANTWRHVSFSSDPAKTVAEVSYSYLYSGGPSYLRNIMCVLGATEAAYSPYLGTDYTTDLPSTVYGGTLDMTTGVLTVDRAMAVFDGTESWTYWAEFHCVICGNQIADIESGVAIVDYQNNYGLICHRSSVSSKQMQVGSSRNPIEVVVSSTDEWKALLRENPLQVVYNLATPQTYRLTPQEVVMLAYNNTIWAECGPVVVTYKALEGDD